MEILEAIFLGIVQGITEFLPISSSGHLVLTQHLMNVESSGLVFEVLVHFATLIAVIVVYRKDIINLLSNPFQKFNLLIIIGTIPTGIIGLLFKDTFEKFFSSVGIVGFMLIITGLLLLIAEIVSGRSTGEIEFKPGYAFVIGIAQGLAITPGISRAGITIAAALMLGLNKKTSARFSFILSIPAILGATLLESKELFHLSQTDAQLYFTYIIGAVFALISGYFAIHFLLRLLNRNKLYYFTIYCWTLALIIIIFLR